MSSIAKTSIVMVREAQNSDAGRIAELAGQLGYGVTRSHVLDTLGTRAGDFEVFVAIAKDGTIAGWIGVRASQTVTTERTAEVEGLVVDERYRGQNLGKALLQRAEAWASERKCAGLRVHTNVVRERAHRFYRRESYELLKSQHYFEKRLP